MGLIKGLFVGVLAGSAIAAALKGARRLEAPPDPTSERDGASELAEEPPSEIKQALQKVRRHAEEALAAAKEARRAKEAELERQFEEAKRPQG